MRLVTHLRQPRLTHMNRILNIALLFAALPVLQAAESVQVGIEFTERKYVPGEKIEAKVIIVNYSGRPLRTGDRAGWLNLFVRSKSGAAIIQKQNVDLVQSFTVPQGKEVSRLIDLSEFFVFHETGNYSVQPVVRWGSGERDYQPGVPVEFDVVQPAKMMEQPFGVSVGPKREQRTRVYTIQRLTRRRTHVFTRVSDEESGAIIGLVNMGEIVSFDRRPDLRLDRVNFLHVLHQSGAREFRRHVISPEGTMAARETYHPAAGRRPRLVADEENRVRVEGGRLVAHPDDQPLLTLPVVRAAPTE